MDFRDPQPYPPNMMVVGSNSFPNNFTPSMMMTPNTTQFSLFNNNSLLPYSDPYSNNDDNNNNNINDNDNNNNSNNNDNLLPHSDPYNNNNNILKPRDVTSESFKRKRGRPRKHSPPDGDTSSVLASTHVPSSSSTKKSRGRGRPLGSRKKQIGAIGCSVPANFTPHVFLVKHGEDVAAKIMAFCEQRGRIVIILSANGRVENVTLRHLTGDQGTVTYKGQYTLLSLTGSFQQPRNNSDRIGMGELCVSLEGLDGRIVGGELAEKLTAASTVQVVVGSFMADGKKSSSNNLKFGPVTPTSLVANDNENGTFSEGLGLHNNVS